MNTDPETSVIERILNAYDLSFHAIYPVQKGYRNSSYGVELADGQIVNLILYKSEPNILPRIKRTHAVSHFLAAEHLPVRHPTAHKIIKLQAAGMVKYGALYNYLPGYTIAWEAYTKNHIKLVGMALGAMHAALQNFEMSENSVADEYTAIAYRMQKYFTDLPVRQALQRKLGLQLEDEVLSRFLTLLKLMTNLPHHHMLHMDFVRGNILFDVAQPGDVFSIGTTAISGILDFEKTGYGHPTFDIARTLAFLLVDCKYKTPEKITKYFLESGYYKRGNKGTIRYSRQLIAALVTLFLTYDFYKFLRHNPYESLEMNEHFLRTRDILVARGVIRYRKEE